VTKSEIFKNLYNNLQARHEFTDKLPQSIAQAFWDNEMIEAYDRDVSMLMKAIFPDHIESIYWFLYEWRPGFEVNDTPIHNIDQYIEYLKANEDFND
jgi:hypothetical protein